MKKSKTIFNFSVFGLFNRALSLCSLRCLFKLAKLFSWLAARTNNQMLRRCRENIHLCFPELDKQQQKELVAQTLWHTSCNFFELAAIWHHPLPQVLGYIKNFDMDEVFIQSKKPKIVIAPHLGSWEMLNLWLSAEQPLYSLYKPAESKSLNEYVLRKRSRNGAFLAPSTTSGLRHLLRGLQLKKTVMILPDQRPAHNTAQITSTFFGYPADTSLLINKLLGKVDCEVFIASMLRDLKNGEYRLILKRLDADKLSADELTFADYLNSSIENIVQCDIAQYQWSYRRFRIQYYHALEHDRHHLDESKFL